MELCQDRHWIDWIDGSSQEMFRTDNEERRKKKREKGIDRHTQEGQRRETPSKIGERYTDTKSIKKAYEQGQKE